MGMTAWAIFAMLVGMGLGVLPSIGVAHRRGASPLQHTRTHNTERTTLGCGATQFSTGFVRALSMSDGRSRAIAIPSPHALAIPERMHGCMPMGKIGMSCRPKLRWSTPGDPHGPARGPDIIRQVLAWAAALVLAISVGRYPAVADESARSEASDPQTAVVDAAWRFIRKNYYEQTFNKQDWDAVHDRFLARASRGEDVRALTREMVASLGNRYSRVVDADTFAQLMAYDPLGVGLILVRNEQQQVFVSSPPFAGSSAARAGISQGDVVEAIDGKPISQESLSAAMYRVASANAETVTLSLRRNASAGLGSGTQAWDATLTRARAPAEQPNDVESGLAPSNGQQRVGYLRLRTFGSRSAIDMREALADLKAEGANKFALDLRGNGGGSFQAAVEIAALFLTPNSIATRVQTPSAGDQAVRPPSFQDIPPVREPLVLLVDQGSASASEVLAASLRENCRASLLGSKTYGKAEVQGVFGLPNGEAVVLTVAKYSGPGGAQIEGGINVDGPSPGGPFSGIASALGLPVDLRAEDYGQIDFGKQRETALRGCVPPR